MTYCLYRRKFLFSIVYIMVIGSSAFNCSTRQPGAMSNFDLIGERKMEISRTLQSKFPVIFLKKASQHDAEKWQQIFIADSRLEEFFFDKRDRGKMLNEIFSISEARPSDLPLGIEDCQDNNCIRIEMYNYALNTTVVGLISKSRQRVVHLVVYKETQPDVPPHLVDLALHIARTDTAVIRAYGDDYLNQKALMPGTKTALNRTKCQRSKHLCVAPTFIKKDKALWVIVDLTELKVAGLKWTHVGQTGMAVTQRSAQNDKVMQHFCDINNSIEKDGWSFSFMMTRSDGLMIKDVAYRGRKLFNQVKLVDWHVSYSKVEGFGYSDAVGCPEFSTAAVLAVEAPYLEAIVESGDTTGFLLGQHYYSEGWPSPCNYNYHQYFEFYKDGRFRPVVGSIGRGCGNNGIYRPVVRIHFYGSENSIYAFADHKWNLWKHEQWTLQSEHQHYHGDREWFKIVDSDGNGLIMLANTGQFRDAGRGDRAYVYVTKFSAAKDEGDTDLPTIGPCCNTDYQQGPEKFIDNEPIQKSDLVLWYVPQVQNDDTPGREYCWAESILKDGIYTPVIYPCYMGPMFKPM